jgi:exopolyphosphatase/guanosine-5'-triphosphate,3'-diphosphate pyrophosphatase
VPNVAAVDIGTNSVRLLIADDAGRELQRPMHMTRLGQDVDVTGRLAPEAIARTTQVLDQYRALAERYAVERMRATATSAARDATNRAEFFDAAERALGVRPELLSGDEEAQLSFQGATADVSPDLGPFLIIDLGGGSTELVLGDRQPEAVVSLQLGCVRMTERHLKSDPPTPGELDACFADVARELRAVHGIERTRARCVIGLAGTVTALAGMALGLTTYDATRTHHSALSLAAVEASFERLSRAALVERRQLLTQPERAEIIVGGAAVLLALMRRFGIDELRVSEHDILDGLVASLR